MIKSDPIEFGEKIQGQLYQPRPGSYAVIVQENQTIAIIKTTIGSFLPGRGAENEESTVSTLVREVQEECGYDLEQIEPIGFAIEYVHAENEGYFAKQCTFYSARFGTKFSLPSEPGHELVWLQIDAAKRALSHDSHVWALSLYQTQTHDN